ncbi:MAG TPA: hypothetical protein PKY77_26195 [Phycisphaerae bacterium]|nr:hypothetical protein [Phycisphaerae bacterium]HRY67692.1 hypothetical protein [Phycisphaerae bacterium]HSA25143.1 hypothetical protein [Phycisphaerae bacterium]
MNTPLDCLLKAIHPANTLDETARRADAAFNEFPWRRARETDWDEFRRLLVQLHRHVEARILNVTGGLPDRGLDFAWGRCTQVLARAYGPSGAQAAFEMARTGNDGGLPAVCRKLVQLVAEEYGEAEIAARIAQYWNGLSAEEKLAAGREYLAKHGHLLPGELTEGSAARVLANLPKVLEQHARLLRGLDRLART